MAVVIEGRSGLKERKGFQQSLDSWEIVVDRQNAKVTSDGRGSLNAVRAVMLDLVGHQKLYTPNNSLTKV